MSDKQATDRIYINTDDVQLEQTRSDEIDLSQLFQKIWAGRGLIVGISLALCLLAGIFFGVRFLGFNGHKVHDIQLRFSFNGAEKALYPNKTPFRLSDIISSQTLKITYEKYNLKDSGLKQSDFSNNISIHPAAVNRDFINAKYKNRLNTKNISQAEIETLENAYKLELSSASHRSAVLSYTSYDQSAIPDELIEKILFDIPVVWSKLAITEHGVLDLPVISINAMNIGDLKNEEYIIGTARIRDNIKLLTDSLNVLKKNERLALVRAPESGLTIKDLNNQLQTFNNYRVEPLNTLITAQQTYRDLATVKTFFDSKLQALQDNLNKTLQKAAIYQTAFNEHIKTSKSLGANLKSPTGTRTEIGDDFFGQLLKLSDEASESKYRQKLTEEQINLKLEAEDIKTEISILERQLSGLNKTPKKAEATTNNTTKEATVSQYNKTIADFSKLINNYNQLMELSRKHALSNNGSLFEALDSEANVESFNSVQLKRVIIMTTIALIIGAMIGVFISLLRKTKSQ